jgi:hypothetical protein
MRLLAVLLFPLVVWVLLLLLVIVLLGLGELTGFEAWVDAHAKWLGSAVLPLMLALSVFGAWKVCAWIWRRA